METPVQVYLLIGFLAVALVAALSGYAVLKIHENQRK